MCGPCFILCKLMKLLTSLIFTLLIVALIARLLLHPSTPNFHVENASLTRFHLSNTTTLSYNLILNLTFVNPNKKIGIHYDNLEATGSFDGASLGFDALPSFYQGHKNTTVIPAVLQGQSLVLGASAVDEFNRERGVGLFEIDVKMNAKIRFRVGFVDGSRVSTKIKCHLKVPLLDSGNSSDDGGFTRTRCNYYL